MRPDGIEDESSEHEHQKVHSSSLCETGNIKPVKPVIRHELASRKSRYKARMGGPLSDASVVELTNVLTRISLEAANMGDCILAAENSQVIAPASVTTLSAAKDSLHVVTAAIEMYMENNKEDDTVAIKGRANATVDEACEQCRT